MTHNIYILRVLSHEDVEVRVAGICLGRNFAGGHAHDPFCSFERHSALEHGGSERHELAAWDDDEATRLAICLIASEYGGRVIARLEGPPAWNGRMPVVVTFDGPRVT